MKIAIVMGSKSDLPVMEEVARVLQQFDVGYEMRILSAHRTPQEVAEFSTSAIKEGISVIIAGAGMSAHLAGVLASYTTVPVIGVPINTSPLNGIDALLSTVHMPPGIPVATVGIGDPGAVNAAILAVEILSINDKGLKEKLMRYREDIKRSVLEADSNIKTKC
ncbi:MAG: 5-(carboxyamino)imidazole ribonucleotide mutase [Deltaproteobacteria bacterium]|nr:5-(carboxyamino)imidazole ribonucleotide mutase [Deltaproteobacteria bacterium]